MPAVRGLLSFVFGHVTYLVAFLLAAAAYVLLAPQPYPGFSLDVFGSGPPAKREPSPITKLLTPTIVAPVGVVAQVGIPLVAHDPITGGAPTQLPAGLGPRSLRFTWLTCRRTCSPVAGATTALFIPRCDAMRCDVGKRIRVRLGASVSAPTPAVTPSENLPGRLCEPSTCAVADVDLLSRYKPILKLSYGEPWAPSAVEDSVADYRLQRLDAKEARPVDLARLPVTQRGGRWRLDNVTCTTVRGQDCYGRRLPKYFGNAPPRVLYGRVWKNPTSDRPAYALQYWLFYYLDAFPNNLAFFGEPSAWQVHESDWEFVELFLNRRRKPVVAAYSQHCGGRLRHWRTVKKRNDHPVVWVALGSHANYFTPTASTPAPALCSGVLRAPGNLITANKGFFDVANGRSGGILVLREEPSDELVNVTNAPRWLFFPGAWGEGNYLRFHLLGGRWEPIRAGDAPHSPGRKEEWLDPPSVLTTWPFEH
jgi:hypothetical protein